MLVRLLHQMRYLIGGSPLLSAVVVFVCGVAVGILYMYQPVVADDGYDSFVEMRLGAANGDLTNPVLECREGKAVASTKQDFRADLNRYVQKLEGEGLVKRVGVSFRDLNNGPSFGVERDTPFVPASLLKVPVLLAFLKRAEAEPSLLDRTLVFTGEDFGIVAIYPPAVRLEEGKAYTVRELLEQMIEHSDNEALALLSTVLPTHEMEQLYLLLGIDLGTLTATGGAMSVREYSSFFRILYNSSFLTRGGSEYALSLLARSEFQQGLRAGVPKDIRIARKFGERSLENNVQHFHDCGIVYYPQHPYLLCIMTQGDDTAKQLEVIQDVASFVHAKVASQYPR